MRYHEMTILPIFFSGDIAMIDKLTMPITAVHSYFLGDDITVDDATFVTVLKFVSPS